MELAVIWRTFAGLAGPAAVATLWQGAALALALALCLRIVPRISAGDRFKVWAAGFAALTVLPFLPALFAFVHSFLSTDEVNPAGPLPAVAAPHAWLNLDPRWSLAIAAAWIAASLARAVDLGAHTLRLRRLWKRAVPLALDGANPSGAKAPNFRDGIFGTTEVVPGYKARLDSAPSTPFQFVDILGKFGSRVEICTTRDLDRPSVIGFFAPRILIPEWLRERLSDAELEQVVMHEAEHLRRHDDWINLAQKLCLLIFPLNPALAWMERRLCREREMACDEGVVRRTQAPRAYAACLASLAERGFEREHGLKRRAAALSLGAWQRRPELVERVHKILRRSPGLHPAATRALLGVVSCGLVFGSVELARCPRLVAFAEPPVARPILAVAGNAMVDGRPMSSFRAIDAVAHVRTRAELVETRMAEQHVAKRARRSPTLAPERIREAGARSILAKANVPAKLTGPAAAQAQQWIVFTAWEQLEPTNDVASRASDTSADDTSADSVRSADSSPQVVAQYTMTELIMRVDTAVGRPAANRHAANIPMIPLPAAIQIGDQGSHGQLFVRGVSDGWLVIQL